MSVTVVRGKLDDATSERLVEFWTSHRALDETAARERLADVVCVLHGGDGEIAGVNSVYAASAPLVERPFWIYRRFVAPEVTGDEEAELLNQAFDALARELRSGPGEPIGVCVVVPQGAPIAAPREAIWPATELVFAGYTDAGAQVRIRYFEGAKI